MEMKEPEVREIYEMLACLPYYPISDRRHILKSQIGASLTSLAIALAFFANSSNPRAQNFHHNVISDGLH